MMRAHRLTLTVLVTLGTLMLGAGSASAATGGLEFLSSFGACTGPGGTCEPGQFVNNPSEIAVDQSSGDVYVVDAGQALDIFNSAGVFQSALTGPRFEGLLLDAAVDEATGQIFVSNDPFHSRNEAGEVEVFSSSGAYEATWTGSNTPQGGFDIEGFDFVAVDNSKSPSDPSAGDVYVATGANYNVLHNLGRGYVDKFNTNGEYLSQFNGAERPEGPFAHEGLRGITVDSHGDVYVFEAGSAVVSKFGPEGKYISRLTVAPGVADVAVNGASGDVYVVDGAAVDLFDSSGVLQGQLLGTAGGFFTAPLGIALDEASGDAYVSDGGPKVVDEFGPASLPPEPTIDEAPSADTGTSVTLHGSLNPGGVSTSYYFSYDQGTSCLGNTTPIADAGSGENPVDEQATVSVEPATQYTVCFYALVGKLARASSLLTFTTTGLKPTVEAPSASPTAGGTTVEAQVSTNKQDTTCKVEYGTTASYGSSTPCVPADLDAEYPPQRATANLIGLAAATTYHYRVVATNVTGSTEPTEGTGEFTTLGPLVESTSAPSTIGATSANVTGTVNPEGVETYYYYQYGPTTEYGQSTAPTGPGIDVGASAGAVEAPATLVPLVPGVTYHYRLVAWNEDGASYGRDETFTAIAGQSPLAVTGPASGVSTGEATISGTINPQGKETSYRFEYGTSTEYGTQAFGTVLPEQGEQTVTLSLRGLDPSTTYHYRLVVSSPAGTSVGEDATFTTPGILDPLVNPTTTPLIATPAIAFPAGSQENTGATKTTTKKLTSTQKLAKALKACHAKKGKKRATCEAAAHSRYGAAKKKRKK